MTCVARLSIQRPRGRIYRSSSGDVAARSSGLTSVRLSLLARGLLLLSLPRLRSARSLRPAPTHHVDARAQVLEAETLQVALRALIYS